MYRMFEFEVYAGCDVCRDQRAIWTRITNGREWWLCDDCKKTEEAVKKNDSGMLMNKVTGLREEIEMLREKSAEQKKRIAELEKIVAELRKTLQNVSLNETGNVFARKNSLSMTCTFPGTSTFVEASCFKK